MATIRFATAPVSWGIMEETDSTHWPTWQQVLDEIAALGFNGTELGPYGFYPTDAAQLRDELAQRKLTLTSAFVPIGLFQESRQESDLKIARDTATLLKALNCPYIVLADAMRPAGAPDPTSEDWRKAAQLMEAVAREFRDEMGLDTVFHLEAGSRLETPADMDTLANLTNPDLIGICLDTGHHAYSGGDPRAAIAKYGKRIRYFHLKDLNETIAQRVKTEGMDFYTAVKQGIFPAIGTGSVDIAGVIDDIKALGYEGWIVVEQDSLGTHDYAGRTPLEAVGISRKYLRDTLGI